MIEHPDVIQTIQTGYPSNEHLEYEREQEQQEEKRSKRYDNFQDFFIKEI